jgi:membrane-associated phospholipid phosphatase
VTHPCLSVCEHPYQHEDWPGLGRGKPAGMATVEKSAGVGTLQTVPVDASASGPIVDREGSRRPPAPDVPLLEPRPESWAESFSRRIGAERPVAVFLAAVVLGYAALLAVMVGLGLVLTQLLLPMGGFAARDESINRWLADHRDPTLEHLSWIGSTLAGGVVIPVVVGACLVAFLAFRRWRLAAFVLFVICIESGAYRATTLIVHRDRPDVDRLESLPVDASFPSGHTAAALALYGGLLLVLASWARRTTVSAAACAFLVAIPLFVAWSRMYRGMHHLTDSIAGLLLGAGALVVTDFAAHAAGAAAARRDAHDAHASTDPKREQA